jgi:predicted phage tail protein
MRNIIGYGGGGKGGGGGSAPTESPDSLHSIAFARVLDLVSEGEIAGLVNGLRSIYLDGTPLTNDDGTFNFQNVSVDYRLGTQDQDYIPGFPAVESESAVGVELTNAAPWSRSVTNTQLSAVRVRLSVPALSKANTSTGDIGGYRVEYAIDVATDGGSFEQVLASAFDGKTTTKYERSERVNLPPAVNGWTVRVRRLTPNANSSTVADTTLVESFTEIIDAKLRYPNSAVVGIQIDARQFNNIPTRSYHMRGRVIRVPSNYDPESRAYIGIWDGTFKVAWTNNPAWVFYDLVLHPRYGLGDRVNAAMVDKWSLYQIGQYCDQLVPDGKGGQEPRFTCNCYLQSRADAYKVLQDLASIFRGMAYWASGNVMAVADMPADPVYTFTAANVVDGRFIYAGSPRKSRYTVALVSWNDPDDFYRAKVEYVPDDEGIARYGVQESEISAFGCTSQGQAQRAGQWILLTSRLETETVSFQVGLDAALVAPGSIIRVADPSRAGRRIGGRVRSADGRTVVLDKADQVAAGDTLTVILPSGVAQTRSVFGVVGDSVTVSDDWTEDIQPQAVWAVESSELKTQLFRVLSVTEADGLTCQITALKHEPGKFGAIDNGTRIDSRPISVIPPSVQPPPANVGFSTYWVIEQGIASTAMVIQWDAAQKAIAYEVDWRRDNGEWVRAGRTGSLNIEVRGIYAGTYVARVRAINALDVASIPAYSPETVLEGKTSPPPVVSSFTTTGLVFGIRLDWAFPAGPLDVERTEIWYSQTSDRETAIKLADFAFPQNTHTMMGLAAGVTFFFWARLVDKSGNIGAWYPTGIGVVGQSSADADEVLDYLNGQITKTQLSDGLLQAIDSVEGIGATLDEITESLETVEQQVDSMEGIFARFDPPMAGDDTTYAGDNTTYAGVWSEQSARAEADMALGQRVDTVAAAVENIDFGPVEALIRQETQARADADGALASQITTVQASVGQNTAAVQTNAEAISMLNGKMSAAYTIKVGITEDGKYYGAGMAIGISNESGIAQSQVLFQADRFALLNVANGAVTTPFVIQNGQTFISQAFIGDGWITNAKIGNFIESNTLGANGQPRWRLDKNGTLTMNGPNVGAGYLTVDDSQIRVYDGNGVLRVRMGIWA